MLERIRILHVEDNPADAELVQRGLRKEGYAFEAVRVQTEEEFVRELSNPYDLILADFELPQFNGLRALNLVRSRGLEIPFILVSGTIGEDIAVEAIHRGASDYLLKDRLGRLGAAVHNALGRSELVKERAQALKALLASEERFRLLIEHSSDIVALMQRDGVLRYVSPAIEPVMGYAPGTLEGRSVFPYIHPEDQALVRDRIMTAAERPEPVSVEVEYRMKHRDGTWRVLHSIGRRATLFDFGPMIVVNSRDWTERKRAEASLRLSEERFRELAENISEGFWVTNAAKSELLYASPAYERIVGLTRETLLKNPTAWLDHVHEEDRARVKDAVFSRQVTGTYNEVFRFRRPDGSLRWLHDQAFPIRDALNQVVRIVGTIEDITQTRTLEAQLRQAQKLEAIGTLAGGIAHDFNNILAAITGYTSLARGMIVGHPELTDCLSEVEKASARAADLVRQILAFGRRQEQQRTPMQLRHVVMESLKLLRATLPATIQFKQDLASHLPTVLADPTQIHQIIMNLGTNAWHAMGDRPGVLKVVLDLCLVADEGPESVPGLTPGPYVRIQVSDTGEGMDEKTRERIFEPFFTTKAPGVGSGLGLAVVHGIVQAHEGAVRVRSEVGKGTTFDLFFPAQVAPEAAVATMDPSIIRGKDERVLLVDDEEILVRMLTRLLEKIGYSVEAFSRPIEARERLRQRTDDIAVVITDQTMPDLTGLDLAGEVRRLDPALPVIVMSGYNVQITPDRVREVGAFAVLQKPVPLSSLAEVVSRACSSRRGDSSSPRRP